MAPTLVVTIDAQFFRSYYCIIAYLTCIVLICNQADFGKDYFATSSSSPNKQWSTLDYKRAEEEDGEERRMIIVAKKLFVMVVLEIIVITEQ